MLGMQPMVGEPLSSEDQTTVNAYTDLQTRLLNLTQQEKQIRGEMKNMKLAMEHIIAHQSKQRYNFDENRYFTVASIPPRPVLSGERIRETVAYCMTNQWPEVPKPTVAQFANYCAGVLLKPPKGKKKTEIKLRTSRSTKKQKVQVKQEQVEEEDEQEQQQDMDE